MQIKIVANQIEEFEKRIIWLRKKLKQEILWCFTEFTKEIETINGKKVPVIYMQATVDVDKIFSVDGFRFYAIVKSLENGIPDIFSEDPKAFEVIDKKRLFTCPHCNREISTRKTKIFLKNDKGELVAFGSTCAKKYFGRSYNLLTKGIRFVQEFKEFLGSSSFMNEGYSRIEEHEKTIKSTIHFYRSGEKYISGRDADFNGGYSTSTKVQNHASGNRFWSKEQADQHEAEMEKEKDTINAIYEYWKNFEAKSNFDSNLKDLFLHRGFNGGLLVFGVYKYFWSVENASASEGKKKFIASGLEVGKEIKDIQVTLLRKTGFETQWGWKSFYTFLTNENAQLIVSCMGDLDHISDEDPNGKVYTIKKAVVKELKEYKVIPQTVIKLGRKNAIA